MNLAYLFHQNQNQYNRIILPYITNLSLVIKIFYFENGYEVIFTVIG